MRAIFGRHENTLPGCSRACARRSFLRPQHCVMYVASLPRTSSTMPLRAETNVPYQLVNTFYVPHFSDNRVPYHLGVLALFLFQVPVGPSRAAFLFQRESSQSMFLFKGVVLSNPMFLSRPSPPQGLFSPSCSLISRLIPFLS